MSKILYMLLVFCLPMLVGAQDKPKEEEKSFSTDLGVGQEFELGKADFRFLKVISDSRCPRQVNCIWPGEAKVLIGVQLNGQYFEKELIVSGGMAELPLADNFLMQISHLRPYPETPKDISLEAYSLRFTAVLQQED